MICPKNENERLGEIFVSLLRAMKRLPDKERIILLNFDLMWYYLYSKYVWNIIYRHDMKFIPGS